MHYKENKDQNGEKGDKGDTGTLTEEQIKDIKVAILEADNPVGTIRISLTNVNPVNYLGFGTWQRYANGRVLIGVDEDDTDFSTVGKRGGSKELQAHSHTVVGNTVDVQGSGTGVRLGGQLGGSSITTSTAGEGTSGNLPPFMTAYIWRRIR